MEGISTEIKVIALLSEFTQRLKNEDKEGYLKLITEISTRIDKLYDSKRCETCFYLEANNYCPIIDKFNDVEFGCINHLIN